MGWTEESKTKSSRSSTSNSSRDQSFATCNPALDVAASPPKITKPAPMNLVLKTRMSRARKEAPELLMMKRTPTTSTQRSSFTSTRTGSTDFYRVDEEVTVTDDGPVLQEDLKEEEVYKKLEELNIVPTDHVPKIVATPSPTEKDTKKTTPVTCESSSPESSATLPVDVLPQNNGPDEDSSDGGSSVISDITGLTGNFTRLSMAVEDESVKQHKVPREVKKAAPLVVSFQEEEMRAQQLLRVAAKKAAPRRKSVSFSTVCVREYERILDINPSCSCGPSIGIGWNYFNEEEILSVDEWESWRETEREPERLVLCREEREELLLSLGYNQKVIAQAVRDIIKLKNKRRQTIHNLGASGVEELVESASRKVKNLRKGKGILSLGKKRRNKNDDGDDEESLYA